MSNRAQKLVDNKIASKKVMVFSKKFCPFCSMAKDVFRKYLGKELDASDYEVLEIDGENDCDQIQDYLGTMTGQSTVPRVFINGKCIGGGTETDKLHRQGKLKTLLN
ncbi:glutaredoxin-like [Gigantopelta aegis]|uniref:glutaredoxin-like n=1 Tax=Gigantopelta aegis TaxID=1735272 RepID=UPI001B88C5E4|nr:glutaredoxin-like [Gigantopelta aegis]